MATSDNIVLVVRPTSDGRFEVRQGDKLLGTSQSEMMAVWSAVSAAERLAALGATVRVLAYRNGDPIEQFVAKPPQGR